MLDCILTPPTAEAVGGVGAASGGGGGTGATSEGPSTRADTPGTGDTHHPVVGAFAEIELRTFGGSTPAPPHPLDPSANKHMHPLDEINLIFG